MKKFALLLVIVFFGQFMLLDIVNITVSCRSEYKTPYYKPHWLLHIVQGSIFYFKPTKEYKTNNAINSEEWLVREVNFCGKEWWTVLETKAITKEKS